MLEVFEGWLWQRIRNKFIFDVLNVVTVCFLMVFESKGLRRTMKKIHESYRKQTWLPLKPLPSITWHTYSFRGWRSRLKVCAIKALSNIHRVREDYWKIQATVPFKRMQRVFLLPFSSGPTNGSVSVIWVHSWQEAIEAIECAGYMTCKPGSFLS